MTRGRQTIDKSDPGTGNHSSGFTLIELLAVIAIMAIILAVALPAFDAFKQRGTEAAIPHLMSTLRLARQYAITHRQDVYVVFPDRRLPAYAPKQEVKKALCSYAVITSNRANECFEYVTAWKYLPQGIFFDDDATMAENVFLSHDAALTDFPFPNDVGGSRNLCSVQFRPNGRAYRISGSGWSDGLVTWIPLTSAYMDVNTNAGTVTTFSNLLMNVTNIIRIRNKTGQIDIMK